LQQRTQNRALAGGA